MRLKQRENYGKSYFSFGNDIRRIAEAVQMYVYTNFIFNTHICTAVIVYIVLK